MSVSKKFVHTIKLYTDYICPFCWVGKGIIDKLKDDYKDNLKVETYYIEIHPETDPKNPPELEKRFPGMNRHSFYDNLRRMGKPYGKDFGTPILMPSSRKATLISEYARKKGEDVFENYSELVFSAYFHDLLDVGSDDVLKKICKEAGLDWDTVEKEIKKKEIIDIVATNAKNSKKAGTNGVPHFILNDMYKISGAQSYDVFKSVLKEMEKVMKK